jgi:uncharacterized protein (TIGR03067 family)
MKRSILAFAALTVLVATTAAADKADADLEKLQGSWNIASIEIDGKAIPAPEGGGTFVFAKGKKLVMKEKGKADKEGTYKMSADKTPKQLDLVGPGKDKKTEVMETIYQIDGDTLKLAFSAKGPKGKRPTAFDSKTAIVMTLKRQKS